MRACIYARYSSERQNETSLEDQERRARERAAALGLTVVAVHADAAVSASGPLAARPGGKALLADALAGRFDVLLIESLDRSFRDLVDQERTVKRLEHRGLRIIGISDGYDSTARGRKVTRIARGLVNEIYLDDLRDKTHRGLEGAVVRGGHAGGLSYGYRSVPADGGGFRLRVDDDEASVVRRIFEDFGAGLSPRRIAHQLNDEGVRSPRGGTWAVSALYGCPLKGSGILNNTLYVGRYIWNRSQWLKDPDSGKRSRVDRPRAEWKVDERPELRIVSDELWHKVRERLPDGAGRKPKRGPPPKTLFGGLLKCGRCGGAVIAVDAYSYGCGAKKDRGTCAGIRAPRRAVDARLVSAVRDDVLGADALAYLRRQVREIYSQAQREAEAAQRGAGDRRAELQAEVDRLVDAIAKVGASDALAHRLRQAEAELHRQVQRAPSRALRISDGDIEAAVSRVLLRLQDALQADVARARALIADLLGPVTLERFGDEVWAAARIDPGRVLVAAGGSQINTVAGEGFGHWMRVRVV